MYAEEKLESETRLCQIINGNFEKRVTMEIAPGVNYEKAKIFLLKLKATGVEKIILKIDNPALDSMESGA